MLYRNNFRFLNLKVISNIRSNYAVNILENIQRVIKNLNLLNNEMLWYT